jgi:O-6-methylguanine DNA methyltransferase
MTPRIVSAATEFGHCLAIITDWGLAQLLIGPGEEKFREPINDAISKHGRAHPKDETLTLSAEEFRYHPKSLRGIIPSECIGPDGSLRLNLRGTPFQLAVWRALLEIPAGETVTYGTLARTIGRHQSHRAVANAVGANPVPVFVPCHRVIRNDGTLGGYSLGLDLKRRLLEYEASTARRPASAQASPQP